MSNETATKSLPTYRIVSKKDEEQAVWQEIGAAWTHSRLNHPLLLKLGHTCYVPFIADYARSVGG